jgi:antirestriction protein ArdC
MLLGMQDFESNYWLSFKQCRDIGGTVKKDEKSTMVVFWKPIVNFKDNESDELPEAKINFLLRYYYLFNIQQCNIPDEVLKKRNTMPKNPKILEAEQIIMGYPNPPEIAINNMIPNPRYLPRLDKIEIQSIDNFHSSDDYYASLFHECIHATGHSSKCNRRGISGKIVFGSEEYSREELIAECGASFLCNISGIEKTLENSASYIANWLQALKQDNRMVLIAASQAQKACDYILNNSTTNQKEAE